MSSIYSSHGRAQHGLRIILLHAPGEWWQSGETSSRDGDTPVCNSGSRGPKAARSVHSPPIRVHVHKQEFCRFLGALHQTSSLVTNHHQTRQG